MADAWCQYLLEDRISSVVDCINTGKTSEKNAFLDVPPHAHTLQPHNSLYFSRNNSHSEVAYLSFWRRLLGNLSMVSHLTWWIVPPTLSTTTSPMVRPPSGAEPETRGHLIWNEWHFTKKKHKLDLLLLNPCLSSFYVYAYLADYTVCNAADCLSVVCLFVEWRI